MNNATFWNKLWHNNKLQLSHIEPLEEMKQEEKAEIYDKYDNFIIMIINKLIELNFRLEADNIRLHKDQVK